MYKIIANKKELLSIKPLTLSEETLKKAYRILCFYEGLKPAKINFKDDFSDLIHGQYIVRYLRLLPIRVKHQILIKKNTYWLIYLFHEVTHQILVKDLGYTGHGKVFNKVNKYLIDTYFDKILDKLFKYETDK